MTFQEFIYMGGYAGYVWSAVGLTVFVLLLNVITARRGLRLQLQRLQRLYASTNSNGENS
jgi:heme exporter protein CcmD